MTGWGPQNDNFLLHHRAKPPKNPVVIQVARQVACKFIAFVWIVDEWPNGFRPEI